MKETKTTPNEPLSSDRKTNTFQRSSKVFGKPCKDGYDSHYVIVRQEEKESSHYLYPCNPLCEVPDFDEIVVFNQDQILPRYLIYYTRKEKRDLQNSN